LDAVAPGLAHFLQDFSIMTQGVSLSKYITAQEQALQLVVSSVQKELGRLMRYRLGPLDEAIERNVETSLRQACGHISAFLGAVREDHKNALLTLYSPDSDVPPPPPGPGRKSQAPDGLTWYVQAAALKDAATEGFEWWRQLLNKDEAGDEEDEGKSVVPRAGRAALLMLNKRDTELEQRDAEIVTLKKRLQLQGQHFYKELALLREELRDRRTRTLWSESEHEDEEGAKSSTQSSLQLRKRQSDNTKGKTSVSGPAATEFPAASRAGTKAGFPVRLRLLR